METWKGIVGKGFTAADFKTYVNTLSFNVWRPSFVVLHNTAVPTFADWHKVPGAKRMLGLQSYYRDTMKWSGGPHLFIADDLIWAFTPLTVPGVHSPSWNNTSWGVEIVGDYLKEKMTPAVKANMISALATLHGVLGLDPASLKLHREDPLTTHKCPGTGISKTDVVSLLTAELNHRFGGDHPPMTVDVAAAHG